MLAVAAEEKPGTAAHPSAYAQVVERARELVPLLARNAAATEAAGQVLPQVLEQLRAAGLFRTVQPRRASTVTHRTARSFQWTAPLLWMAVPSSRLSGLLSRLLPPARLY